MTGIIKRSLVDPERCPLFGNADSKSLCLSSWPPKPLVPKLLLRQAISPRSSGFATLRVPEIYHVRHQKNHQSLAK
jgi:hypothetical protein